jgi:hypothetical protein
VFHAEPAQLCDGVAVGSKPQHHSSSQTVSGSWLFSADLTIRIQKKRPDERLMRNLK